MSHDAAANGARSQDGTSRGKYWWLRWVIIGIAVVVLTVEVTLVWDQLAKAFHSLYAAKWLWVLAAVAAAMASMHSFAQIQRTLLKSAGVEVHQWRSEAAFYAGNALSTTMPGGPVLSATFMYRQQRMWGASPVVASWQLVMSGVLQVVGLALLGLGGAFLLGASKSPLLPYLYARRIPRPAAARAGGRIAGRSDRRHRGESALVVQLATRQTIRHRGGRHGGNTLRNWSRSA